MNDRHENEGSERHDARRRKRLTLASGIVASLVGVSFAIWALTTDDDCAEQKFGAPQPEHCCEAPKPTERPHDDHPAVTAYLSRVGASSLRDLGNKHMSATGNWACMNGVWEPETKGWDTF